MCSTPGCSNPRHEPTLSELLAAMDEAAARQRKTFGTFVGAIRRDSQSYADAVAADDKAICAYIDARDALARRIEELS